MKIQVSYYSAECSAATAVHESLEVPEPISESSILKTGCSVVPEMTFPGVLNIDTCYGRVHLEYMARGHYVDEDGEICSSPHIDIINSYSNLRLRPCYDYPHVILECINTTLAKNLEFRANNYKFYELLPERHNVRAFYGRIGASSGERYQKREVRTPYPSFLFWPIYFEKITKRYVDVSASFFKTATVEYPEPNEKEKPELSQSLITDSALVQDLYNYLLSCSRQIVKTTFSETTFSEGQIATASELLQSLKESCDSLEHFNQTLTQLLLFIPRKTRYIASEYASGKSDFSRIIDREETYLHSMEAVYWNQNVEKHVGTSGFYGKVREATDAEAEVVYKNLSVSLKPHVKHIYHVVCPEKEMTYQEFLRTHSAKSKRAWHGSGNENWLSILQTGLKVNPPSGTAITGKMLGYGVYCALGKTGSKKANGYNSHYNSRWAHGTSSKSFMALLTIAYAPIHVRDNKDIHGYCLNELEAANATCVHAHAKDTFLARDEICCYYEDGIMVTDLVEFE